MQQTVAQIPWGQNILIFTKSRDIEEAIFYINQTKQNNWGRETLALQIKSDLYRRKGKAITNFKNTLPEPFSDLAQQTLKDPYSFDFMTMTKPFNERDIENQLIRYISKFLLELGKRQKWFDFRKGKYMDYTMNILTLEGIDFEQ